MVNRYQRWYGRGIYSSIQEWESSHIMRRMFHPCYWIVDHPLIFLYSIQWEFQDPRMEVLYHIRPYFVGIPLHRPYIGLIYGRYLQFRFLKWPLKYPIQLLTLEIVYGLNLCTLKGILGSVPQVFKRWWIHKIVHNYLNCYWLVIFYLHKRKLNCGRATHFDKKWMSLQQYNKYT